MSLSDITPERVRSLRGKPRPTALATTSQHSWYRISALSETRAEVYVYGVIGDWGVSADDFVRDVSAMTADAIDVRINSEGGDIFDGVAIYNALVSHRALISTYADGVAASAASVIFMAGEKRVTRRASRVMVHRASTFAWGNANDLREMADVLAMIDDDMAGVYAAAAGGTAAEWLARMDATTWYSARDAVTVGLATETEDVDKPDPAGTESDGGESDPAEAYWNSAEIIGILKGAAA